MHSDSFVDSGAILIIVCLLHFLPYLFTFLLIYFFKNRPVMFSGRRYKRWPYQSSF